MAVSGEQRRKRERIHLRPGEPRQAVAEASGSGATRELGDAGSPRSIPGWSVGHQPELGAEAAVRTAPGGQLFVMTSVDDRAPRSLDEEVTVGLYDWDGEEWEQVGYADFPTVSAVLRLSNDALEKAILDAS